MKSGYESGYKARRHDDIASSGAGLPAQLLFNVRAGIMIWRWRCAADATDLSPADADDGVAPNSGIIPR
jgi:hypothetical protein